MQIKEDAPRRRRPPRAETRRRVLEAAARVFAAQGIASSSVSEVAKAAGMTKGAVYSNFATKDELVLALMDEHVTRRLRDAVAAFETATDLEEAVRALGASLVRGIHTDGTWQHLLFEYAALARRDPTLHAALSQHRAENRAAIAAHIAAIVDARGLRLKVSPDELAVTILAISNGLALEGGMDPSAVPDNLFGRLIGLVAAPAAAG